MTPYRIQGSRGAEEPGGEGTSLSPLLPFTPAVFPCRVGCGACCIAPSISSPIPGMPEGKPAGVRCIQLTGDNRCKLFGRPERPAVCANLRPNPEMCGETAEEAMAYLFRLETLTAPTHGEPADVALASIDD